MTDSANHLDRLRGYLPLTELTVPAFMAEVAKLTDSGDPRYVKPILMLADDRCRLEGVMDQMLALLEKVPVESYVPELLDVLPEFNAKSPFWCEQEVTKLLWSERDLAVLINTLARTDQTRRSTLDQILARIDAPQLRTAVENVRRSIR